MSSPTYKICLVGDGSVGKTALRDNFMDKSFTSDYIRTLGVDVVFKSIMINNSEILFQIWDIAGQPLYESVRKDFYKGAIGALAVYDITRYDTLVNLRNWTAEIWENNGKGPIPIIILGNKIDLLKTSVETIPQEQGYSLANELNSSSNGHTAESSFLETSALTGENVYKAFELLGKIIQSYIEKKLMETEENSKSDTEYIRRF